MGYALATSLRWGPPLIALAATLASALPGRAQLGSPPPELDPVRWFNSPPLSFEDLRGKAVLIEFFRTWDDRSAGNVPALGARYAKGAKKGLMVIGVTFEEPETVELWVREREPTYPVAVLRTAELEGFLGIRGYPTQAVLDPAGSLTYVGFSPESALSDALKEADKRPFWPKRLSRVVEDIAKGDPVRAWADLSRVLAKGVLDEVEAERAERLRSFLEGHAERQLERGRELREQGVVYRAVAAVRPIAEAAPPFASSAAAGTLLAEMEAAEGFRKEMKAGEPFEEARVLEIGRSYDKAFEAYKRVVARFEGTALAGVALARAQALIDDGKIGYRRDCETCTGEDEACERHREEAELD